MFKFIKKLFVKKPNKIHIIRDENEDLSSYYRALKGDTKPVSSRTSSFDSSPSYDYDFWSSFSSSYDSCSDSSLSSSSGD